MNKRIVFNQDRLIKTIVLLSVDILMIIFSYWLSMWLRLDRDVPIYSLQHWLTIIFTIPFTLFIFLRIGFYRSIIKYVNMSILKWAIVGSFLSTLLLTIISLYQQAFLPRTVTVIYFSFLVISLCGTRFLYRALLNLLKDKGTPVIIYGAGESGRQLLPILREHREFNPIVFIDDNSKLHNLSIHGVCVFSPEKITLLVEKYNIKKILLAIPSASISDRKKNN